MYRVELKVLLPLLFCTSLPSTFLMYRVELKALCYNTTQPTQPVPNVPCGVESGTFKAPLKEVFRLLVPNVPCGVERSIIPSS